MEHPGIHVEQNFPNMPWGKKLYPFTRGLSAVGIGAVRELDVDATVSIVMCFSTRYSTMVLYPNLSGRRSRLSHHLLISGRPTLGKLLTWSCKTWSCLDHTQNGPIQLSGPLSPWKKKNRNEWLDNTLKATTTTSMHIFEKKIDIVSYFKAVQQ